MKKIYFTFLCTLLTCMSWVGCSDGDTPVEPSISITGETSQTIGTAGGKITVTFTSAKEWTAKSDQSWCRVSLASGQAGTVTLGITVSENTSEDDRVAKVTLLSETVSKVITITQKQKDGLTVTSNKVEVSAEGGDIAIEVKANVKYEYEIDEASQSWIAGGSRALTSSTIKLKVAENENTSKREGKITIRSGELSETVTVYQEGSKPTIVLTQNEYTVASEGETIKVEMKSNVNYEIQLPSVNWIKESSSRSMSVATHYFEVASNEGYDIHSV